jgi:uncharacterized protein YndB with AHSA1/START domain
LPLEASTLSDRDIRVVRAFKARRQLVFDCHTKPELVKRWLWTAGACRNARSISVSAGAIAMSGRITPMAVRSAPAACTRKSSSPRIVTTERMDLTGLGMQLPDGPEGESLNTLVLTEANGQTMLTCTMHFASKQARDGALASGMTDGMEQSYRRFDNAGPPTRRLVAA